MSAKKPLPTLSLAVLGLLAGQPMSGYDIRKVFEETPMGNFSSSPGAIYPALRRLARRGLIEGTVENPDTLRPKEVFELTGEGRRALEEEVRRPVTRDEVARYLDRLMLRFVYAGHVLGRRAAADLAARLAEEAGDYADELRAHVARQREEGTVYGAMAVRQGMESYRALARWAREVAEELSGSEEAQ